MVLRKDIQEDFDRVVNLYTPRMETLNGGLSEYDVLKVIILFLTISFQKEIKLYMVLKVLICYLLP